MSQANRVVEALIRSPRVGKLGRAAADWLDLEASSLVESLRWVAPRAHGRLLDVGCGDKPYEHIFRPFVESYLGIEHDVTYAATNASSRPVKADLLYDGSRLPFEDKTFHTVLSVQVLEHTPEPAELIGEMGRVLRDDGILIMAVPFSFRLHEEPHDYLRFTPHILRELCRRAGLTVEAVIPRGSLWSVVAQKLNSYLGLRVAQVGAMAQMMGKLSHEQASVRGARLWTLPVVAPAMLGLAFWGRVLDRVLPDPTETLGFVVLAGRTRAGELGKGRA
jgi:SAM-dependent methyltransferase